MEFTTQQINRNTVEGKLLLAALAELSVMTNKNTDEVIRVLWEQHKKDEGNRNACISSVSAPFTLALNKSLKETKDKQEAKAKELGNASNVVLQYATPSMNPDDFTALETLLVKLYRHHMNL